MLLCGLCGWMMGGGLLVLTLIIGYLVCVLVLVELMANAAGGGANAIMAEAACCSMSVTLSVLDGMEGKDVGVAGALVSSSPKLLLLLLVDNTAGR